MQSNKEKTIDARTFGEIYNSLNVSEKQELFRKFHIANICSTRQTIWNWATDKVRPSQPLVLKSIVRVLGNFIGHTVSVNTLFPKNN